MVHSTTIETHSHTSSKRRRHLFILRRKGMCGSSSLCCHTQEVHSSLAAIAVEKVQFVPAIRQASAVAAATSSHPAGVGRPTFCVRQGAGHFKKYRPPRPASCGSALASSLIVATILLCGHK